MHAPLIGRKIRYVVALAVGSWLAIQGGPLQLQARQGSPVPPAGQPPAPQGGAPGGAQQGGQGQGGAQQGAKPAKSGVIWFGSTGAAMSESLVGLEAEGIRLDCLRIRAFPFADAIADFIHAHEHVFVVEQNRDAQLRMLLVNECGIDPEKLIPILHYDGNPITERFVTREIAEKARLFNVMPLRKVAR